MCPTSQQNRLVIGPAYAKEILPLIDDAKNSINILMFDWRWYARDFACDVSRINSALVRAVQRCVKVRAITNYSSILEQLREVGIDAKGWQKSKSMHAKSIIIDDWIIVIGSHNLTENAMGLNIEVSSVVAEEHLAVQLTNYFNQLWSL
jgi:phosphatidylserine/phosphatidylglycerophosphate/cardiolipin synthase-like enzyme